MNVARQFDAGLDRFYVELDRERYECCRKSFAFQKLDIGLRNFYELPETHCRTCGLVWTRTPGGDLTSIHQNEYEDWPQPNFRPVKSVTFSRYTCVTRKSPNAA